MSKFNSNSEGIKTTNIAGGLAYKQTNELEFVSILLTSFSKDSYYRSESETVQRLKTLIKDCNKEFVAKAAVYARTVFGMRSITHIVASELAKYISGEFWAKDFYKSIVYRVDDLTEIVSYHLANNGRLSKSMQKGFKAAFGKFDEYQLAKYKSATKTVKLVDVVNLVRPKPTNNNEIALQKLMKNELVSFDTWESELSKAGQVCENKNQKGEIKKDVWVRLIKERKIGYFALLRNLRNIIEQAPEIVSEAIELLTNEKMISKSLVLPFRYLTAYNQIKSLSNPLSSVVLNGLCKAVDLALKNVVSFEGRTLVVLDVSGSMDCVKDIASLFAAVLVKTNNCDFMKFSDDANYVPINTMDSTITISQSIKYSMGGTNFFRIFHKANRAYDRIIILSDMQGFKHDRSIVAELGEYKKRFNCNPFIYSFDLQNYGSMLIPQNNVYCLAGFSEKVFDIMRLLESDSNALVNEVKKVNFL